MTLEISIGPPQLTINEGETVFVCNPNGEVDYPTDKGLYFRDTRLLSTYAVQADGLAWELLSAGNTAYFAARAHLTNPAIPTQDGEIAARGLELVLSRTVTGGVHEDIDIINHSQHKARFNLEILLRSDFADVFEVKTGHITRRGHIGTHWDEASATLTTAYTHQSFSRTLIVQARNCSSACAYANGRLTFAVDLSPGQIWHTCLCYVPMDGTERIEAPVACHDHAHDSDSARDLAAWQRAVLKISTSNEEFYRLFRQAIDDIASLRLPVPGKDHPRFVPAAGVPWFVALFGRDSLIVAYQTMLIYPDFARGALEVLGEQQATGRDDYRDMEPGKIPHELRLGELAKLKLIPHTPYYGTADATLLYVIVFHAAWRSTGDIGLVQRQLPVVEQCLAWIDEHGDRDGDGFQEYQTRSPKGYENMGWKDAGDAVLYEDGTPVRGPKALCELQGYVYDGWMRMAEIYDALDRGADAARLRGKAAALFRRFNEAFWDEAAGSYAYCLDGEKRRVMSTVSNIGHLLWSGIVPPERARRLVDRLLRADMWSGWGIRTLSAEHPAYNPLSYQNGSVWPHDNGLIAMGCKRYGFAAEAARIVRGISAAGQFFIMHRLPELWAGMARGEEGDFPVQYLGANVPQAWAAGSVFTLLQAIIGFEPDAPHGVLYLDPTLPDWMPDLTVRDLHFAGDTFEIAFRRDGERTVFEVLQGDSARVQLRAH